MFRREVLKQMMTWRDSRNRRPLILRGARQVGKTTLVNEFGKDFANYLYFNLERNTDKALLEMDLPTDDLVNTMFVRKGMRKKSGATLIFIDEIQNSPTAVARLRYFFEDCPDLYVVAAGSLLENVVDVKVSFPVGRVDYLPVRPCSFREFVSAIGKESQLAIMDKPELTNAFHTEYMSLFNQYFLVGGMPEVVQHYADYTDIIALTPIYSRLIRAYMDDVEKYSRSNKTSETVRYIIQNGWLQAGATITLGRFNGSEYQSREVGEAFRLLQKAMLLELVYPTVSALPPVLPEARRMPKLFWFDTGLVNYVGKVRKEIIGSENAIFDLWKGRIAEQVVAQELLTLNYDINQKRTFWTKGKGGQGAEVDLLWMIDGDLLPIEVKAGHNSHLRSLHSFMDESNINVAVRVWSGPFSVDDVRTTEGRKSFRLINLPFYLIGNIEQIVKRFA